MVPCNTINVLTLNMGRYSFPLQESIKLVWRIAANLCSVCFLEGNFIGFGTVVQATFIFEVGQSMGELMDFVKAQ